MNTRRQFLSLCAGIPASAALLPFSRALAALPEAADDAPVLVLVRLGGGNDGLNTVIPYEDDLYHRARPSLAIGKDRALPLSGGMGLHPAMEGLKRLFDAGELAVIQSVGYPGPDRSHFASMDIWHTGDPDTRRRRSGWLGRTVDALPNTDTPGFSLAGGGMPLAMVGDRRTSPALDSLADLTLQQSFLEPLILARRETPSGPLSCLLDAARTGVRTSQRVRGAAAATGAAQRLPHSALGRRLATVLTIIAADPGARVFYVAHDGFDTHTRQADNHAALLRDLAESVHAFRQALGDLDLHRRVLLLTFSEFGRRVRENGSQGTDHGAAAPLLAIGPAVHGGVHGAAPDLTDLDDGDVRYRVDFRSIYATVLDRWLGVDARAILPGDHPPVAFL